MLVKYFIPHHTNDFKPHFLREESVLALTIFVVVVFLASFLQYVIITRTDLIAAIFPAVLVDLTNKERAAAGLPELNFNPTLTKAAELKAADMAGKSYFAHISPEGVTPWEWFKQAGYNFMFAGENLAVNFSESVDVDRAWMASPTHRENILRSEFTEIGIAIANGFYQGQPTTYVVQLFGKPTPASITEKEPAPVPQESAPPAAAPSEPTPEEASAAPAAPEGGGESPATGPASLSLGEAGEARDGRRPGEPGREVSPERLALNEEPASETFIETVSASEEETNVRASQPKSASVSQSLRQSAGSAVAGQAGYASFFEELLLSPRRTLTWIYLGLGALIVLAIILMVGIEIGRQHPVHIAYGVLLLVLIGLLFYLFREIVFTEVLVR